MIRFLLILVCISAISVGCVLSRKQADDLKHGAGDIGCLFGLPRSLVEALAVPVIALVSHIDGRRRGKKSAKKIAPAVDANGLPPGAKILSVSMPMPPKE